MPEVIEPEKRARNQLALKERPRIKRGWDPIGAAYRTPSMRYEVTCRHGGI